MRLVIISGFSGSGKSVALHALEDLGFYCIDNIPAGLLHTFVDHMLERRDSVFENVGVGLDARNRPDDIDQVPELVRTLRKSGISCDLIFLQANDEVLMSRFSETRRKHPLSLRNRARARAARVDHQRGGPVHRHERYVGARAP